MCNQLELDEHVFKKHGINMKNQEVYYCDVCDFRSLIKHRVAHHHRSVHTVTSFTCQQCGEIFSKRGEISM